MLLELNTQFILVKGFSRHHWFMTNSIPKSPQRRMFKKRGERPTQYVIEECMHRHNKYNRVITIQIDRLISIILLIKLLYLTNSDVTFNLCLRQLKSYNYHDHN